MKAEATEAEAYPVAEAEAASPSRPSLRKRKAPSVSVVEEMDGLRLCLDPRRHAPGYEGTGYRGVTEDFWPSGFKARKPFTMVHAGKYHGRFATKEEAALHCERLESGLVPPTTTPSDAPPAAEAAAEAADDAAATAAAAAAPAPEPAAATPVSPRLVTTSPPPLAVRPPAAGDLSLSDALAASAAALGEPLPPSFRRPKPGGGGGGGGATAAVGPSGRRRLRCGSCSGCTARATAGAAARAATCPRLAAAARRRHASAACASRSSAATMPTRCLGRSTTRRRPRRSRDRGGGAVGGGYGGGARGSGARVARGEPRVRVLGAGARRVRSALGPG